MKKKTFTKRIVSFITALSLSISSTIMVLPASAWTETNGGQQPDTATVGGYCMEENCDGTYSWVEDGNNHVLKCNGTTEQHTSDVSHAAGKGTSEDNCDLCAAMPVVTIIAPTEEGCSIRVKKAGTEIKDGDKFASGSSFTLEYTAGDNYNFVEWNVTKTATGEAIDALPTVVDGILQNHCVENIDTNVTIAAVFSEKNSSVETTHTVVYDVPTDTTKGTFTVTDANGENLASNSSVEDNAVITIVPEPATDYEVDEVSVNGTAIDPDAYGAYTYTVTDDVTAIEVTFKETADSDTPASYTVTCDDFMYGSISLDGGKTTFAKDETVTFEVTIIESDSGEFIVKQGSVKVLKTSDKSETGITVEENDGKYSFTMPDYDVTITAEIINSTPSVTGHKVTLVNDDTKGTVTITYGDNNPVTVGETLIPANSTLTIKVEEKTGFTAKEIKVYTSKYTLTDGEIQFAMPDSDISIEVIYKAKQYSVKLDEDMPSSVTVTPVSTYESTEFPVTVEYNNDVKFSVSNSDDTKEIDRVYYTINGDTTKTEYECAPDDNNIYTISSISDNILIYVALKDKEIVQLYTVGTNTVGGDTTTMFYSAYYGENGNKVIPSDGVKAGEKITVKITNSSSNYGIKSVIYNDGTDHELTPVEGDEDNVYVCSFIMPENNVTITVTFMRTYKFEYGFSGGEGTIKPYGDSKFEGLSEGDVVKFTINPAKGYIIDRWSFTETDLTEPAYTSNGIQEHKNSVGEVDYYYVQVRKGNPNVTVYLIKTYKLTVADTENGTVDIYVKGVALNKVTAIYEGDGIYIDPNPDDKYELESIVYSYDDNEIPLKPDEDGYYYFEMPAADVTVTAKFKELPDTFEVTNGTDSTTADTWAEVMKFITDNGKGKDVTVTINGDYSFTATDKLPTDVNSLTLTGKGCLKLVGVTALTIPVHTTIDVMIKVANSKNNLIDITVAAGKKLYITGSAYIVNEDMTVSDMQFINSIKGGSGSSLEGCVVANTIQSFASIGDMYLTSEIYVSSSLTKVDKIVKCDIGAIGSATKVEIGKAVGETAIMLIAAGAIPKVTINDFEAIRGNDKICVSVSDSEGAYVGEMKNKAKAVESGTTVLYSSNASKLAKYVSISSGNDTEYTAIGNDKTKEIKAMIPSALTVTVDKTTTPCATLDDAVKLMKENKDYILTLNDDLTVPSNFTFPKGLKSLTIDRSENTYDIIFTGTKLAIPYDVTFNVNIVASNKTDLIDITVAAGATLTINKDSFNTDGEPYINKISGTKTSDLVISAEVMLNNVATFRNFEGTAYILGTVTGVTNFSGSLAVIGEKSTVTIDNAVNGSIFALCKNSSGAIPKLTITDVIKNTETSTTTPWISVNVVDTSKEVEDSLVAIPTGTTLLYTKGKDLSANIVCENKTESKCELSAVYYSKTKSIKAECTSAINVLMDKTKLEGNFKNLDDVITAINSQTGEHDYIIELKTDITADSKFAFPKGTKTNIIRSITIRSYKDESSSGGSSEGESSSSAETKSNTIIFTGTKLAIPYNVTFEVPLAASNKTDLIDVTVAKNAALALAGGSSNYVASTYEYKPYINKLSGDKNTSKLEISNEFVDAYSVSNFKEITADECLYVEGSVSGVGSFYGELDVFGDKASITIDNFYDGSIIRMLKSSKGAIPKLTITDVISKNSESESTPKIKISVFDGEYSYTNSITNGTVVAYTKGKDLSANITFSDVGNLTASYNKSKKTITAVDNSALTLNTLKLVGDEYVVDKSVATVNGASFDEIFKYINSIKYAKGVTPPAYEIVVNSDIELATNFALPKASQASLMMITGGGTLTFTGTKLAVPYNLTIDVKILAENKSGKLDIAVAKDCSLTIQKAYFDNNYETCFGKVTGSGKSALITTIYDPITVTSVSGFDYVEAPITVEGAFTKINRFAGELNLYGEKASADIGTIEGLYTNGTSSRIYVAENSKCELPKITIGSIADGVQLNFHTDTGIGSGKTILYTKTSDFDDVDRITINNLGSKTLSPSFNSKAKTITAVAEYTVLLSSFDKDLDLYNAKGSDFTAVENGNEGKFSTFDEAVNYINKNGNSSTGYYITLTDYLDCPKLTLPKSGKAAKLVIYGDRYYGIDVGKTSSITANTDIVLRSVGFYSSAKTLTLNAKGNVDLWKEKNDSDVSIDAFKGSAKSTFTAYGHNYNYYDITGFGTVHVMEDSWLEIYTTLKTNNLVLDKNAYVDFYPYLKTASFSSLNAAKGAGFYYSGTSDNAPKFTGKAENFKVDKSGFIIDGYINSGAKVLSTKAIADLSIFKYGYDYLRNFTPYFKQVGNDICMSGKVYELESDKSSSVRSFSDWEDVVKAINTANNSKATYTVYINDDVNISKFTFPAKGKYKELIIEGRDTYGTEVRVSGNITLTGNTTFRNISLYSLTGKYESYYATYTVNASGYDLVLENTCAYYASIKAKNLTIENFGYDDFLFNKIDVTDTLTVSDVYELDIVGGITTKNLVLDLEIDPEEYGYDFVYLVLRYGAKLNVTDTLSYKGDTPLAIMVIVSDDLDPNSNYSGNEFTSSFDKNYSLGKVKNGSGLVMLFPNIHEDYIISPDSSGNLYVIKGKLY